MDTVAPGHAADARGKRKGRMGQVVHAEGLRWLERHYLTLPEEEKERLRNLFDSMSSGNVKPKSESPANSHIPPPKN